jgi:hypothetical protein
MTKTTIFSAAHLIRREIHVVLLLISGQSGSPSRRPLAALLSTGPACAPPSRRIGNSEGRLSGYKKPIHLTRGADVHANPSGGWLGPGHVHQVCEELRALRHHACSRGVACSTEFPPGCLHDCFSVLATLWTERVFEARDEPQPLHGTTHTTERFPLHGESVILLHGVTPYLFRKCCQDLGENVFD